VRPKGNARAGVADRCALFYRQTTDDVYPTKPCLKGALMFGQAPKLPGTSKSTLCPNGDVTLGNSASDYNAATGQITNSSNLCLIPVSADGDARCINGKNNFNAPLDPPFGTVPAAQRDGRVFNLHLHTAVGAYRSDANLGAARNVIGDFSRIHATRTLLADAPTCPGTAGSGRCCDQLDSEALVGCLVEADACSIGFAGGTRAADGELQTSATVPEGAFFASINDLPYAPKCVASSVFPLSKKLYLSTTIGFENVTAQELDLAKCFSGSANGFSALLAAFDLVPLPNGPVCEDFAQERVCPGNFTANDACADNPIGIPRGH
jgi:hypothetical protein